MSGTALTTWTIQQDATPLDGRLLNHVWLHNQVPPVVGTRAARLYDLDHVIDGWHYDRRQWVDDDDDTTRNQGYIGYDVPRTTDQTIYTYWKSGIGGADDCDLKHIILNSHADEWLWSPVLNHGYYYSHQDEYYLWSDHSVLHPLISDFVDTFDATQDKIALAETPKVNTPIYATIFRREDDFSALPYKHAHSVGEFRGTIISVGSRNDTLDSNNLPIYANVDSFHIRELYHRVEDNTLYFNQNFAFKVCPFTKTEILAGTIAFAEEWMNCATANGEALQKIYTRYFPLSPPASDSAPFEQFLYVLTWTGSTFTEWTLADNNEPYFHTATDHIYWVDYDLGIINFGGYKATDTYLRGNISSSATEIVVHDASDYPPKGVITLATGESVSYLGIIDGGPSGDTLVQCTRGYGSTAGPAIDGTTVTHVQQGMAPLENHVIGVSYETTPRIEYEPEDSAPYIVADNVDVRPVQNEKGNGIVYISRRPLSLASITLEIDKTQIGNALYGPVYAGADYAILTATGLSAQKETVPGVDISIGEITSPFVGLLNNFPGTYTAKSNANGQVKASFVPGADDDALGKYVHSRSVVSGGTELLVVGDYTDMELDEVSLFGVTKDDPMIGTVGLSCNASGWLNTSSLVGSEATITPTTITGYTVSVSDVYGDDYFTGATLTITMSGGTTLTRTVVHHKFDEFHIDSTISGTLGTISEIRVMADDWIAWEASFKNGKKKVVYLWDSTAIHPTTGSLGAYSPLRPTSATFDGTYTHFMYAQILPAYSLTDDSVNLATYWLTAPIVVTFQAYGDDPFSGSRIYSNLVSIQLELPEYLKGVYDGTIPYGTRLGTTVGYTASGLGGSTFLSLNMNAGTPNPWASLVHLITI